MQLSSTFLPLVTLALSASAAVLGSIAVTNLPANAKADYQLGGAYTPASDVKVVSRDRTDPVVSGLYNICYINAFQTQPGEKDFWTGSHNDLLLKTADGDLFEDPDWEGEYFLDTSTDAKRKALANIINPWIAQCAKDGFQAIEPDNLDTFTRSDDLLTQANNLAFANLLATYAHSKGLAIAQKNTGDIGSAGKDIGFDFAVVEECQRYNECEKYSNVYGSNFIEIEYTNAPSAASLFSAACKDRGSSVSVILRDIKVVPKGSKGYSYKEC